MLLVGCRIAEGVFLLPQLLRIHLLRHTHLTRGRIVAELIEIALIRILRLLLNRLLRLFGRRKIELILRAAIEIHLLRTALNLFEKHNRPPNEEYDDDSDRNAACDDFALVFGAIFEIVDGFLHYHRNIVLRTEHNDFVFFACDIARLDRELLNRLRALCAGFFQELLE